jgi:hypothetical protein
MPRQATRAQGPDIIGSSVPADITSAGTGLPGMAWVMMMLAVCGAPGGDRPAR